VRAPDRAHMSPDKARANPVCYAPVTKAVGMQRAILFGLVLALRGAVGCSDDQSGIVAAKAPGIEVREGAQSILRTSTVVVSSAGPKRFSVANPGEGNLVIKTIGIETEATGAYTITAAQMPSAATPVTVQPGGATWDFALAFDSARVPTGARPRATIRITSNTTLPDGLDEFVFAATPETSVAKLVLQPPVLDFATVAAGTTSTKPLNLLNTGSAALATLTVRFSGDPGFTAVIGAQTITSGATTVITLSSPLNLAPSSAHQVDVTFASNGPGPARAELTFLSSDPGAPEGTTVYLYANLVGPCIRAIPTRVDFGAKLIGQASVIDLQLESCGDLPLEISSFEMLDDGGNLFDVDLSGVRLPLTLAPGVRTSVPVSYFPTAFAALGSDGQYIKDRGSLRVNSNAYVAALDVALAGFGSGCCCPVAVIDIAEGDEVIPQTELHLSSGSSSASGEITRWEWSVLQPNGSVSQFFPAATNAAPTFKPNVVGTYVFRLDVYDAAGNKSCAPAEQIVEVKTDDALHVELLWRTPGDINETDEGGGATFSWGSDVDLHFLHPLAVDKFFDPDHDCYWLTPLPDWGPVGELGNPRLDRDDRDGGGPENLNMKTPEDGARYTVGVHYYNDWGYGNAFATVRVYVYGVLRDQWNDVQITNAALWESHQIEWPSGKVTRVLEPNGGPRITPGYPLP